jgi:hypothetical protein
VTSMTGILTGLSPAQADELTTRTRRSGSREQCCTDQLIAQETVCRSGWSGSAAGSARAEDVIGEHGDGAVDEAYVPVAAGVVGELLAG